MLLRCLRAELIKFRRSPVWLAFVVLPIFPAILGTMNYLGNLGLLQSEWYSLWSQHTLFAAVFFMPAQFGVFCAWQWRLEHADHNWNAALTAPVPVRALYLGKLLLDVRTLLGVFQTLLDSGATVVVIEHDLDVIRSADFLLDMGPGGGEEGGRVVALGTPEQVAQNPDSVTGRYLR